MTFTSYTLSYGGGSQRLAMVYLINGLRPRDTEVLVGVHEARPKYDLGSMPMLECRRAVFEITT